MSGGGVGVGTQVPCPGKGIGTQVPCPEEREGELGTLPCDLSHDVF